MDIYANVGGGHRVPCISLEFCVIMCFVICLVPSHGPTLPRDYKFPARLTPSNGTKGHIDKMWRLFCEEVKPENMHRLKDAELTFSFRAGHSDKKFTDNHPYVLRCRVDPILMGGV